MKNRPPLTPEKKKRLIPRLGREKDIDLSAEFNVSRQRISQMREERNIPAFNSGTDAMTTAWPIRFTQKVVKKIKRAMKITGHTNRSEYIRDAVEEKNDSVLKENGK